MTEGVVLTPYEFSITFGVLPYITATHELVVPRSIPMTAPVFLEEKPATNEFLKTVLIMRFIDVDKYIIKNQY